MEGFQRMSVYGLNSLCFYFRVYSVIVMILSALSVSNARVSGDECGQNLNELRGYINSPNYPLNYPNDKGCKWHINLSSSQVATLSFQDFELEGGKSCLVSDTLSILPEHLLYCGSTLPPPYISMVNTTAVTISFNSDSANNFKGFSIEYFVGDRNPSFCDADHYFKCFVGNCIPVEWTCNGQNECSDSSDEAYDLCHGDSTTPPPPPCLPHAIRCLASSNKEPICLPESKKCDGHRDCADGQDEDDCSSICKHYLEGNSGSFSSPRFPDNYDNDLDCAWTLAVSKGQIIQLRFDVFDLELGYKTDYVGVYDGVDFSNEIGLYYAFSTNIHVPPKVIEGQANELKVTFITDASSTNKGFNATYQTKGDCMEGQKLCEGEDHNCYAPNQKCDNRMTCIKGDDEVECVTKCGNKIACFESSSGCFTKAQRCDGKRDCTFAEDEADCDVTVCNHTVGRFLCDDNRCIVENKVCDSMFDCRSGFDEKNCYLSTSVITAAAVGSMVCALLLLAALSCTCKLYQLHVRDRLPPSHMSPLREIEEELLRREAPPSYTATMASPHFDEAQRSFIEGIQAAVIARNESRSANRQGGSRRQRGTFVRMLSRDRNLRASSQPQVEPDENTAESQTETLPPTPTESGEENFDTLTPQNHPIPPVPPLRRISGELGAPVVSPSSAEAIPQIAQAHPESASSSVSDTDSETNDDALQLAERDHQILRAAANIRRMRLAGGLQNVMQAQDHRAARSRSRTGSQADITNPTDTAEVGPSEASEQPSSNTSNTKTVSEVGSETNINSNEPSAEVTTNSLQPEEVEASNQESLELDTSRAETGFSPIPLMTRSPRTEATSEDDESRPEQAEAGSDSNEDGLSRSSSKLSIVSATSVDSGGDDVPMLKP